LNERELIQLCNRGNEKAQKELYDCYANQMFRVCLRYTGNYMDADDVMISAFYKVFKNLAGFEFRGEYSLQKWIKTIMINESLMFLRNSKKIIYESIDHTHVQITNEQENDIDAEQIHQLILQLPDGYRTVLNLFVLEGMSHEEIAIQLGISINTSKSQLSRARALLKEQLFKIAENGK
jgi:RNA polymerase sigma factor (sigma-70 family)